MDKYDLVLDIIEHPEKYTPEQLAEMMSEPETREIYNLLCKTASSIKAYNETDINAEWTIFAKRHTVGSRPIFSWFGSRAASIAAIAGTSIVAVAAGIAITVSVINRKSAPVAQEETAISYAISAGTDTLTADCGTVNMAPAPVVFENETLEKIMNEIAVAYGVEVVFNNKATASLHLYYKLDLSLPLNEVVEQLNTFDQISIRQNGDTLNID